MNPTHLPKVNLCERFQKLCPHQPVGTVPEAQHIGDELQSQVTGATAAQTHDTVLENEAPPGSVPPCSLTHSSTDPFPLLTSGHVLHCPTCHNSSRGCPSRPSVHTQAHTGTRGHFHTVVRGGSRPAARTSLCSREDINGNLADACS